MKFSVELLHPSGDVEFRCLEDDAIESVADAKAFAELSGWSEAATIVAAREVHEVPVCHLDVSISGQLWLIPVRFADRIMSLGPIEYDSICRDMVDFFNCGMDEARVLFCETAKEAVNSRMYTAVQVDRSGSSEGVFYLRTPSVSGVEAIDLAVRYCRGDSDTVAPGEYRLLDAATKVELRFGSEVHRARVSRT